MTFLRLKTYISIVSNIYIVDVLFRVLVVEIETAVGALVGS